MNKEELIDRIVDIANDNSFDGLNESRMDGNVTELLKDYDLVKKNDSLPDINIAVCDTLRENFRDCAHWQKQEQGCDGCIKAFSQTEC